MKTTMMPRGGKGDKYRPVDKQKWDNNWDRIFGNDTRQDTSKNAQDVPQDSESFGQEKI